MHGRQREEYKALQRDPAVAAKLAAKAEKWYALSNEIAHRRRRSAEDKDASNEAQQQQTSLALTEKMLLVNPDPMYLWNFRRELLLVTTETKTSDAADAKATVDDSFTIDHPLWSLPTELAVTQAALENNPKSYGAWFHRKWALLFQQPCETTILENELALTAAFLQRDERNFHCWNYRRFIVTCLLHKGYAVACDGNDGDDAEWWNSSQVATAANTTVPSTTSLPKEDDHDDSKRKQILQTEWEFTDTKIHDNFSNFSAFHYRSKLLQWKLQQTTTTKDLIAAELELVSNAIFTEPDDQTAWWYAQFLLDSQHLFGPNNDHDWFQDLLTQQIAQVQELAEEMPNSKWVHLGLYNLLKASHENNSNRSRRQDRIQLLQNLVELDPDRAGRYNILLHQETEEQDED